MITKLLKAIWSLIEEFFATQHEVVPVVEEPTIVPVVMIEEVPNLATVRNFCLAIQSREGYIAPCKKFPLGTSAYRNNNPGNCKGIDGNFLKFPTYEIGFAYLEDYIKRVQENKHKAYPKNPSIFGFFSVYAPSSDANDPVSYSIEVATKLGVATTFLIKDLA